MHSRSPLAAEAMAARVVLARAIPSAATTTTTSSASISFSLKAHARLSLSFSSPPTVSFPTAASSSPYLRSSILSPARLSCKDDRKLFFTSARGFGKVFASSRGYRKTRRKAAPRRKDELELDVKICIEEQLPDDPEILVL